MNSDGFELIAILVFEIGVKSFGIFLTISPPVSGLDELEIYAFITKPKNDTGECIPMDEILA